MVVDLWGRCATCHCWFDCGGWVDRRLPEPACPRCGDEPLELLNLAARFRARVLVDARDRRAPMRRASWLAEPL